MNAGPAGSVGPPSLISRPGGNAVSQPNHGNRRVGQSTGTTNLADLLERVLDKGIVIAGDITVSLGQVELLSIKLRLVVASIDKAQEIGIDWWRSDPALSSRARQMQQMETQNRDLTARLDRMEQRLQGLPSPQNASAAAPFTPPAQHAQHAQQRQPPYPSNPGPATNGST